MESPPQISVSDSDWQRTPRAVQGLVVRLGERVAHLEQIVEQQTARIAALEQELARRKDEAAAAPKPRLLRAPATAPASADPRDVRREDSRGTKAMAGR